MRWVGAVCLGVDRHLFALGKRAYKEWDENVGLARGERAWKARLQGMGWERRARPWTGMGWERRARPWGGKQSETIRIRLISS